MTSVKLETLIVSVEISEQSLAKLKKAFDNVHYYPDGTVPRDHWKEADVWYSRYFGFPEGVKTFEDVPRTRAIQLSSAGANIALSNPVLQTEQGKKQIKVCSASGIHSLSIPQWIVSQIINLYTSSHIYQYQSRNEQKWVREQVGDLITNGTLRKTQSLYGKTAGLLGYGHIGREAARALKALNVKIIAANSNGKQREDDGYIVKGTGDPDGSIPEAYYSTNDPESFKEFLSKTDILIASLPSTPATKFLLKKEHFDSLPDNALFLNVGRGDLAHSEDILAALNAPKGLYGVALDVTDPEPLTAGHELYTHPRAIITPHVSGDFEGYFDAGADLLLANVEHYRKKGSFFNVVDPEKGY